MISIFILCFSSLSHCTVAKYVHKLSSNRIKKHKHLQFGIETRPSEDPGSSREVLTLWLPHSSSTLFDTSQNCVSFLSLIFT